MSDRPVFQKMAARAEYVEVGEDRTLPGLFRPGSGMRRFVTAPDLAYRAGYTRVSAGQGFKTFFWYDEFWVVLEGTGNVRAVDRLSGAVWDETLAPHDLVYIPAGTHITLEVPEAREGHILFFYIAIPASAKHAPWLASMTPEDIEDIKVRAEHTKEGFEQEAKRGGPARAIS